jgi:hypothetical protein
MKGGLSFAVLLFAVLVCASSALAKGENTGSSADSGRIPVPQLTGRVVDKANLLLPSDQLGWVGRAHRWVDWTIGYVAVTDPEIEELYRIVADGTRIEIRP